MVDGVFKLGLASHQIKYINIKVRIMTNHYWCSSCERAFPQENPDSCIYDDCRGKKSSLFRWEDFRKQAPDTPEIPEFDEVYKLDYFINEI